MKKCIFMLMLLFVAVSLQTWRVKDSPVAIKPGEALGKTVSYREIKSIVKKGESLYDIFKKNDLDMEELFQLKHTAEGIHKLKDISVGNPYSILLDEEDKISEFTYTIDDEACISIARTEDGFFATKKVVNHEKRIIHLGGVIRENLISSVGEDGENVRLALRLSDIFAWDIDFTTDLRKGNTYKIVTEGLYRDGNFVKYGEILFAEFANNGNTYKAYRFECDGKANYFDEKGQSLRKSFLKAPLNFRRISSGFSGKRFHPILKIHRPHHGIDYAAQTGTPVVSVGDGIVSFSGRKGQYGALVVIKHANQYSTCYGHLSRIAKGIRKGARVEQGEVVGYVGSTGLASGPHLHYEMRIAGRPINPMTIKMFAGGRVPEKLLARFRAVVSEGNSRFAGIDTAPIASTRSFQGISELSSPGT